MKLLVITDAHIYKTSDGLYWSAAIYDYTFWTRYLEVFDSIKIASRVKNVDDKNIKWKRVDGPGIEIGEITFFRGPRELMKNFFKIEEDIKSIFDGCDAALYRLPSPLGQLAWMRRPKNNMPTAVEVVYDISDELQLKGLDSFKKVILQIQSKHLKSICRKANGVSYVTENSIQSHYPSKARLNGESEYNFESYYSTIMLNDDFFGSPKDYTHKTSFTLVISDVAMNSYRKGEITLFKAMKILVDHDYDINAIVIGDGSKREEFEKFTEDLCISGRVKFTGLLSSSREVREYLDAADIYVFPTSSEGLPRGVLEAMAVGLPVITSPVGGIPEIIDDEYLIPADDYQAYAFAIENLIRNPSIMNDISEQNINIAHKYNNSDLQIRRNEFYKKILKLAKKNL